MTTFKRFFLARRRYDAIALAAAFALLGVADNIAKSILVLFICCGIYLAFGRHRAVRHAPRAFSLALFAYGAWAVALSLLRGEPAEGNRQLVYSLIAIGFVFFPIGLVLIAQPLRAVVSGARLGVLAVTILAVFDYAFTGARIGLGENAAILAFITAMIGVLSRISVLQPCRLLPDSRFWFYLSAIPVVLSQTRGAWFIYVIALLLDATALFRQWRTSSMRPNILVYVALGIACLAAVPGVQILRSGIEAGISQFVAYSDADQAGTSVGIRMAMWQSALGVIADNPIVGVGSTMRIEAVAARAPPSNDIIRQYNHLHNLFLDEALSSGLVGVALMLSMFAVFVIDVWRRTTDYSTRETACLLVFLVISFGMFHGVMLHETTLMAMFAAFMSILVDLHRRRLRTPHPIRRKDTHPA